jgi:hypothetical protein
MKRIYLALIIMIIGCNFDNTEPIIVTAFNSYNNYCEYTVQTNGVPRFRHFNDSCGKFNIGDTVKFIKTNK